MSMTTRCSIATTSSPGSGYFHAFSTGWPAFVSTRYMSPTLRSSCWSVAIFFESGDHSTIGAVALRPAGVVGRVAEVLDAVGRERPLLTFVATSRTHRFQSLMKTPLLPSGDIDGGWSSDDIAPPPLPKASTPAASPTAAAPAGVGGWRRNRAGRERGALRPVRKTAPFLPVDGHHDRPVVRGERDVGEGSIVRVVPGAGGGGERRGNPGPVERRHLRLARRIGTTRTGRCRPGNEKRSPASQLGVTRPASAACVISAEAVMSISARR